MAYSDEKNECCKEIETKSLIALCEIENYDKFCEELESLIRSKRNRDLIFKMYRIMQGRFTIGYKKYKKFVQKYKDVIEIMKKYNCLSEMTILKYNPDGRPNKSSNEDYFFEFVSKHKEDIETIKHVATKIENLGFDKIIYGEQLDFSNIEYELNLSYGTEFKFLDNIEVIPKYNNNPIKYITNGSNYCMTLHTTGYDNDQDIIWYYRKIKLNSLIFDPNRLPDEISKESTIEVIKQQVESKKEEYQAIKDTVNMSVSFDDLMRQFQYTKSIIEKIDGAQNKEELNKILDNILREITELKLASLAFSHEIIDGYEKIDEDKIESEKKLYLGIRNYVDIY